MPRLTTFITTCYSFHILISIALFSFQLSYLSFSFFCSLEQCRSFFSVSTIFVFRHLNKIVNTVSVDLLDRWPTASTVPLTLEIDFYGSIAQTWASFFMDYVSLTYTYHCYRSSH